jgi:carboxymethylenebutenolidase
VRAVVASQNHVDQRGVKVVAMKALLVLLLLPSTHSIALRAAWGRAVGVVAPVVHHIVEPHQLQSTTLDRLTNVAIPSDEGREVLAFAARPADGSTGPRPVLVLLHEFFGLSESIVDKAQGLADELGCLVVAPDVFRGVTTDFIPRAIWLALSTPQLRVNADVDAVLRWAAAQDDVDAERVAVMGFCFGGGKAIGYTTQVSDHILRVADSDI